jgi:adenylate cyclase
MEIERKFLIANDRWKEDILSSAVITQFYLTDKDQVPTVRLRLVDGQGTLTIKYRSVSEVELARDEFEYSVPKEDVEAQITHATGAVISKTRHRVKGPDAHIWEVDVFSSPVDNLILAEIELDALIETFEKPDWVGQEVTQDHNYSNLALSFRSASDK